MSISKQYRQSRRKRRHQTTPKKGRFKRGFYKPLNEDKYIPTHNKMSDGVPEYRSSWELKFMQWLDNNPEIIKWASEPFSIAYYSTEDQRIRNYFPDFYMEYIDGRKIIVEIKPNAQKVLTRNQEKWAAAEKLCREKELLFVVMTEIELKSIL